MKEVMEDQKERKNNRRTKKNEKNNGRIKRNESTMRGSKGTKEQ